MMKPLLAASLTCLLLPACAAMPPADRPSAEAAASHAGTDAAKPDRFEMIPGQRHAFGDAGTLRYVAVTSDSRCPPDVQCVWAGDATVAFEWLPTGGKPESFALHTGLEPRSHPIAGHTLRLVSLQRGLEPAAVLEWSSP